MLQQKERDTANEAMVKDTMSRIQGKTAIQNAGINGMIATHNKSTDPAKKKAK